MKLTSIEIKNFRGIKHASVFFPLDSQIICLIGAGDSGKSTLLTAIEWTLWPSWSLIATDTDFYDCDTSSPIEITVSIMEIPQALMKEDKFGLYLRDYDKARRSQMLCNETYGLPCIIKIDPKKLHMYMSK